MILDGDTDTRMKQILEFMDIDGPKILIANYEQVVAHRAVLDKMNFDAIAYDEAQFLARPTSKRTEACLDLYADRYFCLTGTPMLNHVDGLWSLLWRVGAYKGNYYQFCNRYVVFGGYKDKQIIGVKNEEELRALLQNYMLRRLKSDVLDLPKVQIIQKRVSLTKEQQEMYDLAADEMKLLRDSFNLEDIKNRMTRFLRLKQICCNTVAFTGEDNSAKLDMAVPDDVELVENGHKVVVFTQFRHVQQAYIDRMNKLDVPIWVLNGDVPKPNRQPLVKEWSMATRPGVLVCMIQVAGIGLNMTASRHVSFLDKLFVPGLNQQGIDRVNRIGADKVQPIQVREYIARNTIESRIEKILKTKVTLNNDIVEWQDSDWEEKITQYLLEDL
jgi:SNF2 family DNA or RNA helicase